MGRPQQNRPTFNNANVMKERVSINGFIPQTVSSRPSEISMYPPPLVSSNIISQRTIPSDQNLNIKRPQNPQITFTIPTPSIPPPPRPPTLLPTLPTPPLPSTLTNPQHQTHKNKEENEDNLFTSEEFYQKILPPSKNNLFVKDFVGNGGTGINTIVAQNNGNGDKVSPVPYSPPTPPMPALEAMVKINNLN